MGFSERREMGRALEDCKAYLENAANTAMKNPNMTSDQIRAMYLQGIMMEIAELVDAVERLTYVNGGEHGN